MSAKNRYLISPKAQWDLESIWRYTYETWSREQANAYYNQIIEAIELLAEERLSGREVATVRRGYLALAVQSHFVLFKKRSGRLIVVRILHQRMNIAAHL